MKNRERRCKLEFYVFEEEKEFILKKMEVCKINNMSAYLRKVAIDGKIEINDYSWVRELNYNLNKIGVNINQIAKRVNETGSVYKSDMNDINNKMDDIYDIQNDNFIADKFQNAGQKIRKFSIRESQY